MWHYSALKKAFGHTENFGEIWGYFVDWSDAIRKTNKQTNKYVWLYLRAGLGEVKFMRQKFIVVTFRSLEDKAQIFFQCAQSSAMLEKMTTVFGQYW